MSCLARLTKLRCDMVNEGLDAVIIIDRSNTYYYTSFRGTSSIFIVLHDVALFMTDSRYHQWALDNLPSGIEVIKQEGTGQNQIKLFFNCRGKMHVGFESSITYEKYRWLSQSVRPSRLVESTGIILKQRLIKSTEEIQYIKKAATIVNRCSNMILKSTKPGMRENEIAKNIRRFFEDSGAEGESFPCIVASGSNAALPHHRTSQRKIRKKDLILVDMGCVFKGYCSDMTRTFFVGEASEKQIEVYNIVLEAQILGLEAVRPGMPVKELDARVRDHIAKAGYGDYFGHNTGHGVGIDIHEKPVVGPRSDAVLEEGMFITIEPGIYLPGEFGVRIEDLVMVSSDGARRLTRSSKKLCVLKN